MMVQRAGLVLLLLAFSTWFVRAGEPASRDDVWRMIFARPSDAGATTNDPVQDARVELGRALFHDTRLSGDETMACATCHQRTLGFSDGRKTGVGRNGRALKRNVPSLYNLAWSKHFFWDGRAESLEEQARGPLTSKDEMAGTFALSIERLLRDDRMVRRFERAFPKAGLSEETILAALAAFERTLVSPRTRFDDWIAGDEDALNVQEKAGFDIFVGKGGCVSCHGGWRFTDDGFHDIGLPGTDPGRGSVAGGVLGAPQFKTPGLRELVDSAPYMHDGSKGSLMDVVDHYAGGLVVRASLDSNVVRDLALSSMEKAALIAFLRTLSSSARTETDGN